MKRLASRSTRRHTLPHILAEGGELIERRIRTEPERFAAGPSVNSTASTIGLTSGPIASRTAFRRHPARNGIVRAPRADVREQGILANEDGLQISPDQRRRAGCRSSEARAMRCTAGGG